MFRLRTNGQQLVFEAVSDNELTQSGFFQLNRNGDVLCYADLYEKQRTTPIGHKIDVAFSSGNYAVSAGAISTISQIVYSYSLVGKTMNLSVYFSCALSAGTAWIRVTLPFTTAVSQLGSAFGHLASGSQAILWQVYAGGTVVEFNRDFIGTGFAAGSGQYFAMNAPIFIQ
jgi:hypothetical protein